MRIEQYNVVFYGDIASGKTREQVKNNLMIYRRMEQRQIELLFTNMPFLLKHEVNYTTALRCQISFEWVGVLSRIEPTTQTSEECLSALPQYYNVVFSGQLCEGYVLDDVKCNLMVFLHLTKKRLDRIFDGRPALLMQNVDSRPALRMQISFELAGAICQLERVKQELPSALETKVLLEAQIPEQMLCPKCGFQQPQARKCRHCGMYVDIHCKKRPAEKEVRREQQVQRTDAAMRQELLYWGIGLSVFGAFQWVGSEGVGIGFTSIGLLNLLFGWYPDWRAGRNMFLVNGLTLLGSGASSLMTILVAALYGGASIPSGIEHVESSMMIGGILLLRCLQISAGFYGVGRFKQYASTPQLASKKRKSSIV